MATRVVILGVAVAAAGGAGHIAKNLADQPPQVIVEPTSAQPAIRLSEVLTLSGDLPLGATVDGKLTWKSWPASAVSEGFITREQEPDALEKLKGSVARVPLYSGEPLRRAKLIGEGQSFMSSILPSGRRAIATRVAADTSAGGFILPNDFVDIIMTRRTEAGSSGGGEGFNTETILRNIRVLAIDQAIQEDEDGRKVKVGETATLELTPEQAEIITTAQQIADRLTLSLRSIKDSQEVVTQQADYLSNGRSGTVRLIKSGAVSEVGARK